jgi:hypothetical protein
MAKILAYIGAQVDKMLDQVTRQVDKHVRGEMAKM